MEGRLCVSGRLLHVSCSYGLSRLYLTAYPGYCGKSLRYPQIHSGGAYGRHSISRYAAYPYHVDKVICHLYQ